MPLKKSKSKEESANERRFGVILEDINDKFQQVLEGHDALDKKFDKKIDDFRYEVRNEISFLKLSSRVLKDKVDDLLSSGQQILDYLKRIDDEIQDLKKILYRKADLERLEHLEKRVAQIELVVKKWQE